MSYLYHHYHTLSAKDNFISHSRLKNCSHYNLLLALQLTRVSR